LALDVCADCEQVFPFGKGLKDGRCPSCAAGLKERRAEARKAAKPERGPGPTPEPEPEPEPERKPEPEAEEPEEE